MSQFASNNFASNNALGGYNDQTQNQNTFNYLNGEAYMGAGLGGSPPLYGRDNTDNLNAGSSLAVGQPSVSQNFKSILTNENEPTVAADLYMQTKQRLNIKPLFDLVTMQRSQLYTTHDRFANEQNELMEQLRSGGGLLGTSLIILNEKVELLRLEESKTVPNAQMLEKLRIDGVYVNDPQTHQKFTDINVQKLEERVLKEMKQKKNKLGVNQYGLLPTGEKLNTYFKMNGEIKLHNDLLADEITRPSDLAFETTEAYQLKEVNSILSNRLHSFKKRYFRLDIVVGKVCLLKYPQFFSQEDKLAIELRELYKEYERRTSLAMIPFYQDRLRFINQEKYRKGQNQYTSKDELDFLKSNVEETQRKLDKEKREVQEMAQKLYTKWKEIKEVRKANKFSSTNVKLKVHKTIINQNNNLDQSMQEQMEDNVEYYFNLMHEEPSGKKYDGTALPSSEVSRRNAAMGVRAYVRLIINGKYVARSRKVHVKWPNFDIEIGEQFQVCLFTMPSSIQLELVFGTFKEQLVDVINVEVPGHYVKALTSAASLIRELNFSKFAFEKRKLKRKFATPSPVVTTSQASVMNPASAADPAEGEKQKSAADIAKMEEKKRKRYEEQLKREKELEQKAIDLDVNGVIYVKAEWKGEGPDMPPMRSENIFKQRRAIKVRQDYTEDEQERMLARQLYIDVNDPRNERIIRFLKETKNGFLQNLLLEDSKNPLFQLVPFRHMLLEARSKDPDLAKIMIPLLEKEIIENDDLLTKLEVLHREQAYREYLEKKAEDERMQGRSRPDPRAEGDRQIYIKDAEDNAIKYDAECIKRRQIFFDYLKRYQREIKSGHQKASTQYKSIVREFELLESENPLVALFNKIFITGRKLRPVVQKRQPVAIDNCKEAKIMVHIIKGFNVPIRRKAKQDILEKFQNPNRQDDNMMRSGRPGPFVGSNYGRAGMSGMSGGLQGMSASMNMRGNFNQTGLGQLYPQSGIMSNTANRMINGVPLDQTNVSMGQMQNGRQVGDVRALSEYQIKSLYRIARVETLVQVRIVYNDFESEVKITNVAEGDFPEWNEILNFAFFPQNGKGFDKKELLSTKTMIYITLLDREITPSSSGPVKLQDSYRYLGSFSIPLISILNNPPKIDAIFKVNRPLALFNYDVETNSFFFLNSDDNEQGQKRDQGLKAGIPNTYISMSISIDPVLEIPQDSPFEYYPGKETSSLLIALTEWQKSIKKKKFEKRNIKCYGENIEGQSVLLCRYITPQAPPTEIFNYKGQDLNKDETAIEKAARYVSLIPFIEDNQAFTDMPDLFCDSQEFLDLGAGDFEEHAILLCNYFNFIDQAQKRLDVKSYLALGTGFPEGRTAYVLRRHTKTNHVELWNPIKGEAYYYGREIEVEKYGCIQISSGYRMNKLPTDAICQLRSIGCVIDDTNIWANVQEYDDPGLLDYNLENGKCWKKFFTDASRRKFMQLNQIKSIQPEPLQYMPAMESKRAELISQKIQDFISERFEAERIQSEGKLTKWNQSIYPTLRDILFKCEMKRQKARLGASNSDIGRDKIAAQKSNIDEVSEYLKAVQDEITSNAKGLRAWGFPINVTFVSLELLWEEVKNTQIHLINKDEAEFSFVVYIEPYPHNVLSVWFYILALTPDN